MQYVDKVSAHALKHVASKYLPTQSDVDEFVADIVLTIGYDETIEYTDKELYMALMVMGLSQGDIATLRGITQATISRALNN